MAARTPSIHVFLGRPAVKMFYDFIQAWVRQQILNLWSLLRNTPFSMSGKILVIHEGAGFKNFPMSSYLYKMPSSFHCSCAVPWLQQKCRVATTFVEIRVSQELPSVCFL